MKRRDLPNAPTGRPTADIRPHFPESVMARWDSGVCAAAETDDRTISIYDVIGHDYWTGEGVTAKRIAGALRKLGAGPVQVDINSPGGDLFEGLAIYNMLRAHDGPITVRVLGIAASAASVIAMAGDTVQIGRAAFLMVHNAWILAIGNRHELRAAAEVMEPFDDAMAGIYAAHTGESAEDMAALMDAETWIGGAAAVEQGFADELLPSDQISENEAQARVKPVRVIEGALRASGMSRSDAKRAISEYKSSLTIGGARDDAGATVELDADALNQTAALAASLLSIAR